MKEYIAVHHVQDHAGARVTPGEIFEADYSAETEERLIRLGAIRVNGAGAHDAVRSEDDTHGSEAIEEAIEYTDIPEEAPMIDVMEGVTAKKKRGRKA